MNWKDLTVAHYQALYPVITSKDLTPFDREVQVVSILHNITETQIDHLPLDKYKQLRAECSFIHTDIPGKPKKYIKGKKRRYKVVYQVDKIPFSRYAEIQQFKGETEKQYIDNLHMVVASMVVPMRRRFGIWVVDRYDAGAHGDYAEDLLESSFVDVFHTVVFFYHLYTALIKTMSGYMIGQMMKEQGKTRAQAMEEHAVLCSALDGFITANALPPLSASQSMRLGRLLRRKQ